MPYRACRVIAYHTGTNFKYYKEEEFAGIDTLSEPFKDAATILDFTDVTKITNRKLRMQVTRFAMVLHEAYKAIENHSSRTARMPQVLKIFIAPEFLFRPLTANKYKEYAYTQAERDEFYTAINTLVSKGFMKHWVVIPGTFLWMWEKPDDTKAIVMNSSMIKIGGTTSYRTVTKKNASKEDGIEDAKHKPSNLTVEERETIYNRFPDRIARIGGYNLGLEICMDHDLLTMFLKTSALDHRKTVRGFEINFHTVSACGMSTQVLSQVAKKGSYFIKLDGVVNQKKKFEVRQILNQGYNHDVDTLQTYTKAKALWDKTQPSTEERLRYREKLTKLNPSVYDPEILLGLDTVLKYVEGLPESSRFSEPLESEEIPISEAYQRKPKGKDVLRISDSFKIYRL